MDAEWKTMPPEERQPFYDEAQAILLAAERQEPIGQIHQRLHIDEGTVAESLDRASLNLLAQLGRAAERLQQEQFRQERLEHTLSTLHEAILGGNVSEAATSLQQTSDPALTLQSLHAHRASFTGRTEAHMYAQFDQMIHRTRERVLAGILHTTPHSLNFLTVIDDLVRARSRLMIDERTLLALVAATVSASQATGDVVCRATLEQTLLRLCHDEASVETTLSAIRTDRQESISTLFDLFSAVPSWRVDPHFDFAYRTYGNTRSSRGNSEGLRADSQQVSVRDATSAVLMVMLSDPVAHDGAIFQSLRHMDVATLSRFTQYMGAKCLAPPVTYRNYSHVHTRSVWDGYLPVTEIISCLNSALHDRSPQRHRALCDQSDKTEFSYLLSIRKQIEHGRAC